MSPRPSAPDIRVEKWDAGKWSDASDAVVTEEPLQLMLDGEPLSVIMRTPGNDIELALGLLYAEGIARSLDAIKEIRISAESGESVAGLKFDASIVDSNTIDVHLSAAPRRRPERSMISSSACGVCGAVLIEDLRRDLAVLADGPTVDSKLLPLLVERLRAGQGVFERTGGLHASGLFTPAGELICVREDVGRHNALDKVVGWLLLQHRLPATATVLVVSGRAGYEIVQKSITAGIPVLAAVGAPSSLAVALSREFHQTLVGFLRGERFNVYAASERLNS